MALLFESYLNRARTCQRKHRWKEAQRAIHSALHILPTSKEAITCQVEIYGGLEEWEQAARVLEHALIYHPYWTWAILELAELSIHRLQRASDAWRWLQRLKMCQFLTKQEQVRWWVLQASALAVQDRLYEASRMLSDGLECFPSEHQLLFLHGWIALQLGNHAGAVSSLERLLKQDPEYADAHYYLALAYQATEQVAPMREQFRWTYALDCEDGSPLYMPTKTFQALAKDVLCAFGQSHSCSSIRCVVQEIPPVSVLDEFPHNPRRSGIFFCQGKSLDHCEDFFHPPMGTLILFQRNIERFCAGEDDIRVEIFNTCLRELGGIPNAQPDPEWVPPVAVMRCG